MVMLSRESDVGTNPLEFDGRNNELSEKTKGRVAKLKSLQLEQVELKRALAALPPRAGQGVADDNAAPADAGEVGSATLSF